MLQVSVTVTETANVVPVVAARAHPMPNARAEARIPTQNGRTAESF